MGHDWTTLDAIVTVYRFLYVCMRVRVLDITDDRYWHPIGHVRIITVQISKRSAGTRRLSACLSVRPSACCLLR